MYGFTAETQETTSNSKFIQVTPETAIATGRFIKEMKFEENGGNPYFEIIVSNKEDQTANRRYYEPKIDGTYVQDEAGLKKAAAKFNGVMANIARRFLGDAYVTQGVTSFESLCKKVIADIGTKHINKELRVKVILNKENYPTLPGYSPIFENIETNPSKLKIDPKFDNVVSTFGTASAVKPDDDFQTETYNMPETQASEGDMPF